MLKSYLFLAWNAHIYLWRETRCCRTRKEYIDILRELRRKHPDMDMPTLESMAASEVLNRGPKSRAFYRIQATRKLTGGGNLIRRKAATDRRDSVIDDTAFATIVDDDVTRLFFEPGHYTVFENVGACQLTVVRQVSGKLRHLRCLHVTDPPTDWPLLQYFNTDDYSDADSVYWRLKIKKLNKQ